MPTILTEEQAQERLKSDRNLVSRFGKVSTVKITEIRRPGRTEDVPNIPAEDKVEIATRARLGESQTDLAAEYGITQPAVGYIERGEVKLDEHAVEERISSVQDMALQKLMASLGFIDNDKLKKLGAKDLAGFAANMSKVVTNTMIKKDDGSQVHLHLYSPELRPERSFEIVEVRPSI